MTIQLNIFHNTINLQGDELNKAIQQAKSQEERIGLLMTDKGAMTPFEVLDIYNKIFPIVPIGSIRRAMTNLEKRNVLIKTTQKKQEQYGSPNYKWIKI